MATDEWISMSEHMQKIRLFSRLCTQKKYRSALISTRELELLSKVALSEAPLTPLQLSRKMELHKSIVSRIIERLSQKGLLLRQTDKKDRRSYTIVITAKGNEELKNTYRDYLAPIYALKCAWGNDRLNQFLSLLEEANHILHQSRSEAQHERL